MGMFTDKILELIAQNPQGLRTVEIADKVDCDLDMVESSIREAIAARDVTMEEVIGPNQRPTKAFYPSDVLVARFKATQQPLKPWPAHVKTPATAATKSRAELGIEYIQNAGPDINVVDDDLRRVMNLNKVQYPSAWLGGAVERGLVHRDGKFWRAGPAPKVSSGEQVRKVDCKPADLPPAVEIPHPVVTAKKFDGIDIDKVLATADKEESKVILQEAKANFPDAVGGAKQKPAESGGFSCALWSDGELQIARNGQITETLTFEELRKLRAYLSKTATLFA